MDEIRPPFNRLAKKTMNPKDLHPSKANSFKAADRSRTCGEATIGLLSKYGVDTVFGIPGVHTLDFCRGLSDGAIRHVQARNEHDCCAYRCGRGHGDVPDLQGAVTEYVAALQRHGMCNNNVGTK